MTDLRSFTPRDFQSLLLFEAHTPGGVRKVGGALFGKRMLRLVTLDETRLEVTHKVISARRVEAEVRIIPNAPPGPFATDVRFFLDDPDQQLVVIPVYGRVEPQVRVEPPVALLPSGSKPGAVVATFIVRVPQGRAVTGASASGALKAVVKETDGRFEVELSLPTGEWAKGVDDRLELQTDVPGEETVVVPLVSR